MSAMWLVTLCPPLSVRQASSTISFGYVHSTIYILTLYITVLTSLLSSKLPFAVTFWLVTLPFDSFSASWWCAVTCDTSDLRLLEVFWWPVTSDDCCAFILLGSWWHVAGNVCSVHCSTILSIRISNDYSNVSMWLKEVIGLFGYYSGLCVAGYSDSCSILDQCGRNRLAQKLRLAGCSHTEKWLLLWAAICAETSARRGWPWPALGLYLAETRNAMAWPSAVRPLSRIVSMASQWLANTLYREEAYAASLWENAHGWLADCNLGYIINGWLSVWLRLFWAVKWLKAAMQRNVKCVWLCVMTG